jgi:hypothetical protein
LTEQNILKTKNHPRGAIFFISPYYKHQLAVLKIMLTHTSSGTLAKNGIFMNAVDTGWVTDEDPAALAKLKAERDDFQPPLDIVDGAARVMDPLFDGINTGKHWCGKFLKDYRPIGW